MWDFGVGTGELVVSIGVYAVIILFAGHRYLWTWSLVPSMAFGVMLSPADLVSMLMISLPLTAIAFFGFFILSTKKEREIPE